jgi:hypothetical protein
MKIDLHMASLPETNVFDHFTSKVQVLLELAADEIISSIVPCPETGS